MTDWRIYTASGQPHDGVDRLPPPPNWRHFDGGPELPALTAPDAGTVRRLGQRNRSFPRDASDDEVDMVNAALYLRRPLLVSGDPGSGKSSLAYDVARELRLGPVLRWPVTSRTTLAQGLYHYDPIARLRDENLAQARSARAGRPGSISRAPRPLDIGRYVTLGPLGTALLPFGRPRVLLIDEIDKSDLDLPNDLLNIFEDGEFTIPELERVAKDQPVVDVMTADDGQPAPVRVGRVRCRAFPFVVMTSNNDRDFPPAFLRRCLRLALPRPTDEQMAAVIERHLGSAAAVDAGPLIRRFMQRRDGDGALLATDQLLSAVYLTLNAGADSGAAVRATVERILADLGEANLE